MARNSETYRSARRSRTLSTLPRAPLPTPERRSLLKYSGRLVGAGASAAVLALFAWSVSSAGVIDMTLAFILLIAAWFVAVIGAAAFAEDLKSYDPFYRAWGVAVFAVLMLFLVSGAWSYEKRLRLELTSLTPDTLPTPPNDCDIPNGYFVVLLGSNVSAFKKFPHDIITIGKDDHGRPYPMLRIDRGSDGHIAIAVLRIFDGNGKIITRIDNDELFLNSNFRSKKPDAHTLIVYDEGDVEMLRLHYINDMALEVLGIFFRRNIGAVKVDESGIIYPFPERHDCNVNNNTDYSIK